MEESTSDVRPPPSATCQMRFWEWIYPSAMSDFQSRYPKEPKGRADSGYSIRPLDTWDEVYNILRHAKENYDRQSGLRGGLRRGLRRVALHSEGLTQISKLVPNVDYASPIVGALEIISSAAKKSIEVRDEISTSLDDLENNFGDIDTYLATFPNDESIMKASTRLVSSIFRATEEVIGYYIRNEVPKAIAALFYGPDYQQSLIDSLQQIKSSSQILLHQAHNSNMWQSRRILEVTQNNSSNLLEVNDKVQIIASAQIEMKSLFEKLERELLGRKQQQEQIEKLTAQNAHLILQLGYHCGRTLPMRNPSPHLITSDMVLSLLDIPELEYVDIEYVIQHKKRIPAEDRARTERILETQQFREWTVSATSRELLIHGNFNGTQYISGLTFFCCSLLEAMQNSGRFPFISFFCGRHIDEDDPYAGGRGMIQSLISQLLRQSEVDMTHTREIDFGLIEQGDIQQLCKLFEWCVYQVPQDTALFCIIDGVKYYEREQYLDDVGEVLVSILELTRDDHVRCAFKVLITSPSPTTVIRHAVDEEDTLSMAHHQKTGQSFSHLRVARTLQENFGI